MLWYEYLGSWGLIFTVFIINGAEPDFERLFPISTYEQVHQTLIKVWNQQRYPEQQIVQLTKLMVLIDDLKRARSQLSENKQNRSDLDYQIRLLDYIRLDLAKVKLTKKFAESGNNLSPENNLNHANQVASLLALVRVALENLT